MLTKQAMEREGRKAFVFYDKNKKNLIFCKFLKGLLFDFGSKMHYILIHLLRIWYG